MDPLLTIGEFSKMTHLSVKALRHYHDVGLLEPALIDPATGYRRYASRQVPAAQAIRRFRDLDMPIEEIRRVLQAPDAMVRNRAIVVHLERMHERLEQTQATVASLQALLTGDPHPHGAIDLRRLAPTRMLAVCAPVAFETCDAWLGSALARLHEIATTASLKVAGADGALYPDEFFADGTGDVTAFVPVLDDAGAVPDGTPSVPVVGDAGVPDDTAQIIDLPACTVAVIVHDGPFADLDQAYGTLGTAVAERGIGGSGPIREHYLGPTTTEVCWPVMPAS